MVKVRKNMIGMKFGYLTVLEQTDDYVTPHGHRDARFICECICGKHVKVTRANLYGTTKSCGCMKGKNQPKIHPSSWKTNEYDLSGEYGIGYTRKGEEFWFDKEDYDLIKNYCWRYRNGYVAAKIRGGGGKFVLLHRLVMGDIPEGMVVDHKRHPRVGENKVDNRKQNLEIKTNSQNMMNAHPYSTTISGVLGVTYDKTAGKWQSRIGVEGKRIHLGWFDNKEDAVKARKEAEIKYYKEYRFDNYNK